VQASEEELLIAAAAGGDDGAFHALVDRHAPQLFRVARSMSRTREDAEDLLQDTFVAAHRGLRNFAGRSSLKTWLLTILTRKAATAWQRSRHSRRTLSIDAARNGESDDDRGGRHDLPATDGTARSVEQRMDVAAVLRTMSTPYREILVLREVRGLSYEEIAQVLGVPRGTVESRLSRARADFRTRFGERDG
jgi:RNA polymerase sigma-70 factor (ECF subfamily)